MVTTQFSTTIKCLQSDNGTEFLLHDFYHTNGIIHKTSCVATPQQNGLVERKHQHLLSVARALRFQSNMPLKYWDECIMTAAYIINRLPLSVLQNKSPFEVLFNTTPAYENFHVFGCRIFPCLRDYAANKFYPRSVPCICLGYSTQHKGFRCLDTATSRIYVSRHA